MVIKAILLIVFALLDRKLAKKEIAEGRKPEDMITGEKEKIHIEGLMSASTFSQIASYTPARISA